MDSAIEKLESIETPVGGEGDGNSTIDDEEDGEQSREGSDQDDKIDRLIDELDVGRF